MSQELENIIKVVGLILTLCAIYGLWTSKHKKQYDLERDLKEAIKKIEALEKEIKELRERVNTNDGRIDQLNEHYRGMVDELLDYLRPNRRRTKN